MTRVAIVGAGYTGFRSITPDMSWEEEKDLDQLRILHCSRLESERR